MTEGRLTCPKCLQGNHLGCSFYVPRYWEGGGGRCVCRCQTTTLEGSCLRRRAEECGHGYYVPAVTRPAPVTRRVRQPKFWTPDRLRDMMILVESGMTSRQVAETLGAPLTSTRTYIHQEQRKTRAAV